ncbi:hypothetical protein DB30_07687 [Enhygromyxa salina]|uniref:Uncharacterized protein n=1 Tax=Enhygromyxa salina TaxID=215803 RepID=A0A0C2DG62_9BACT|nr:hypothetical protein [Enhygromyxa salina]KIG18672.1 hypothetical protein DB30_07687 [Enhygromyxa salina]
MDQSPPWEHFDQWRHARADLLDLLEEAVRVRDGVIDDLTHPYDDALSQGVAFYVRWRGTLRDLSRTHEYIDEVHFQRGVFAVHGLPIRLYRADADTDPPARVLDVSSQERAVQQMLFALEYLKEDKIESDLPDARLRIRTIPDEDNRIAEFVFEELDSFGEMIWKWSIRAENVPVILANAATHIREPVRQETPKVGLRLVDDESAADDED